MTVILDFDYTLLDTAAFKDALIEAVAGCGVSRERFLRTFSDVAERPGVVYDYDPDLQIELLRGELRCPPAEVRRRIDAMVARAGEFLYPGAVPFLERLRTRGARLVLLTLGNERWQKSKIEGAGLNRHFDAVVAVNGGKNGVLAGLCAGDDPVYAVNDNGAEVAEMMKVAPACRYIIKKGPKGVPEGLDAPVCETFDEIEKLLVSS